LSKKRKSPTGVHETLCEPMRVVVVQELFVHRRVVTVVWTGPPSTPPGTGW
jgi:hypothetical protein